MQESAVQRLPHEMDFVRRRHHGLESKRCARSHQLVPDEVGQSSSDLGIDHRLRQAHCCAVQLHRSNDVVRITGFRKQSGVFAERPEPLMKLRIMRDIKRRQIKRALTQGHLNLIRVDPDAERTAPLLGAVFRVGCPRSSPGPCQNQTMRLTEINIAREASRLNWIDRTLMVRVRRKLTRIAVRATRLIVGIALLISPQIACVNTRPGHTKFGMRSYKLSAQKRFVFPMVRILEHSPQLSF